MTPSPSPSPKEQNPPGSAAAGAAPKAPALSIRDALWRDGLPILQALTGKAESACRAFLGKLLQATHDDCAKVYAALREAESLHPAEPGAWLMKACGGSTSAPVARPTNRDTAADIAQRRLARLRGELDLNDQE